MKINMLEAKLLLSSSERKALLRASQFTKRNSRGWEQTAAEHLCEELDDGGIWNPCFLCITTPPTTAYPDHGFYGPTFIISYGIDHLDAHKHDLRNIKDRLLYLSNQPNGDTDRRPYPPFLSQPDYYGPNWEDVREKTISRDNGVCTECGLARGEHRDRFDEDLHVHHRVPLKEFGSYKKANELDNLETLCRECHLDADLVY